LELAKKEGLLLSPEGAATWQAMIQMKNTGLINGEEKILLLNTGSAYKYMDALEGIHESTSITENEKNLLPSSIGLE
jgi:threonine synthase